MKVILLVATFLLIFNSDVRTESEVERILSNFEKCRQTNSDDCTTILIKELKSTPTDSLDIVSIISTASNIFEKEGGSQVKAIYNLAMTKAKALKSEALISSVYERLGAMELYSGNTEEGFEFFTLALEHAETSEVAILINKAKVNLGTASRIKGDIDQSASYFHEAISGFEKLNLISEIGYPYMGLGILYGVHGEYENSIVNFKMAYDYFLNGGDTLMIANSSVNLANTFISNNQLDSAGVYLKVAIKTFERYGNVRSVINTETQLGRLYVYQSRWEEAINIINKATKKAKEQNIFPQVVYNYRLLSEVYIEQNQLDKALNIISEAVQIAKEKELNNEYVKCLDQTTRIHDLSRNYKEAYYFEKESRKLEDSLFTIEKKLKIEELEAKFESEKKEKEIANLNALNAIAKIDKLNLIWGISFLSISAFLGLAFLYFKNKKNKLLLVKERDIEIANRKNVELENTVLQNNLELKKKELVSSALLISKKKAFLESLKDVVNNRGEKAIHLIEQELQSESEWKSFIQVFNQTHNAFLSSLNNQHPDLSQNEVRLICLIKMNMSSKEIATMINISYEGVKKAKYRLKKKLHLGEDDDLTDYLIKKI